MKLFMFLFAVPLFAGIDEHIQKFPIDAYVSSYTAVSPAIPGSAPSENRIAVSISTSDEDTQALYVYLRVRLSDGTETPFKTLLTHTSGEPMYVTFSIGKCEALKIVHFWVVRMHSQPNDELVKDLSH